MRGNPFGHIDLRVPSVDEAMPFYAALLPHLGFTRERHDPEWKVFAMEGEFPSVPWVAFVEQPDHRPNENRLSFWAASRREVDRLAEVARSAGARNVSGPKACPDYSASYYAVFFEDPCGNRFEICFRTD